MLKIQNKIEFKTIWIKDNTNVYFNNIIIILHNY